MPDLQQRRIDDYTTAAPTTTITQEPRFGFGNNQARAFVSATTDSWLTSALQAREHGSGRRAQRQRHCESVFAAPTHGVQSARSFGLYSEAHDKRHFPLWPICLRGVRRSNQQGFAAIVDSNGQQRRQRRLASTSKLRNVSFSVLYPEHDIIPPRSKTLKISGSLPCTRRDATEPFSSNMVARACASIPRTPYRPPGHKTTTVQRPHITRVSGPPRGGRWHWLWHGSIANLPHTRTPRERA